MARGTHSSPWHGRSWRGLSCRSSSSAWGCSRARRTWSSTSRFGWILHLFPILILLAAALARAGRTRILQATALAVTVFIVPILATLRADTPVAAALHPVGALLAFWLAIVVARGATSLVRASDAVAPAAVAPIGG